MSKNLRANQPSGTAGRVYKAAVLGLVAFAIVALAGCGEPEAEVSEASESLLSSRRDEIKEHIKYLKQRFKKIITETILDVDVADGKAWAIKKLKSMLSVKTYTGDIIKDHLRQRFSSKNSTIFREKLKKHETRLKSMNAIMKKHVLPNRHLFTDGILDVAKDMMADPVTYYKIFAELRPAREDLLAILKEKFENRSPLMHEEMKEGVAVILGTLAHELAERSRFLVESKKGIMKSLDEDLQNDPDFKLLTSAATDGGRRLSLFADPKPYVRICGALQSFPAGLSFCVYLPLFNFRVTWEVCASANNPDEPLAGDLEVGFGVAKDEGEALHGMALGLTGGAEVPGGFVGGAVNMAFTLNSLNSLDVHVSFGVGPSATVIDLDFGLGVAVAVQPYVWASSAVKWWNTPGDAIKSP